MFVVTFYSYKGGVGRTSALVNTCFRLAAKGKTVFIVDFDLEAPGVDSFYSLTNREPRRGIVEYVTQYAASGDVPPLRDYIFHFEDEQIKSGSIFVMPAGRKDEAYQMQLSRLDWKHFYQQRKGFLFVENLKAAIEKEYKPDYV